jgi:AcrR family transcriptional regulator
MPLATSPKPRGNAAERILAAAAECVPALGAAGVSLQAVADQAGVSKALIHYHFKDRDALLARLVDWLTLDVLEREEAALADARAVSALDTLWQLLDADLRSGRLRALVELGHERGELVREAARRSRDARRQQMALTIERIFDALALRPRVPAPLIADVTLAFVDGLAVDAGVTPDANHRLFYDVFWLSVLSLAE